MINKKHRRTLVVDGDKYNYYSIPSLIKKEDLFKLPYSIKVLLESVIRQYDGKTITKEHVENLVKWGDVDFDSRIDVPFMPSRVLLQDFTGVPVVVDFASMRKAIYDLGGKTEGINPQRPVDLVIDHSVQVDEYASHNSLEFNMNLEFERNEERYRFLNWAQKSFENFRAVPPATGIVHQVNLEYLADVVHVSDCVNSECEIYPDTLVGTDSHTTMINGLGVLAWGVGGIEAEVGMLGKPLYFPVPEVVGVKLTNRLQEGVCATDLALKVTHELRKHGVVGKFVEFFGEGMTSLTLADRATVANMAPEYGATCGFFPVDNETLSYLKLTGRSEKHIKIVEAYCKENCLFYNPNSTANYSDIFEIDLSSVEANLAGPKRPQDLIPLSKMKSEFRKALVNEKGIKEVEVSFRNGDKTSLKTGSIAIAAITSCTNTSNPYVLIGAGLVAKKAVEYGLEVPKHVKTSLAPGSKVVTGYLRDSGLLPYLEQLGFGVVGYGCTTCIGNSGPLKKEIEEAITNHDLLVTSVLSGNRNFEGRIHPLVKGNYLASPPLVVVYALCGTVDIDLMNEPIGKSTDGKDVYLKDIWPQNKEIFELIKRFVTPELFKQEYANVYNENERWNKISSSSDALFAFDEESTYIKNPPFFDGLKLEAEDIKPLCNLRVVGYFGDSVTTDHISPAGSISENSPAGKYLLEKGVRKEDFNSYGSRRGNHEVMMRGTFANIRLRNKIAPDTEGGYTCYWNDKKIMNIYDACMKYKEDGVGLVILAGRDYGMGSSRDWAAKGTSLLGIKTVIAESYERIHRSNLVLMGVLPLQFKEGESAITLGLKGNEIFIVHIDNSVEPKSVIKVTAKSEDGKINEFEAIVRFDSIVEVDYYRHGGILQMVVRNMLSN